MFKMITTLAVIASLPIAAQGASCKRPIDAMIKAMRTPRHMYFTANGERTGEMIAIGDTHYLLMKDHIWKPLQINTEDDINDVRETLKTARMQCDQLPHENVNGVETDVYVIKIKPRDDDQSTHTLWLNSDNLPVKGITQIEDADRKQRTETIFVYNQIKAPN